MVAINQHTRIANLILAVHIRQLLNVGINNNISSSISSRTVLVAIRAYVLLSASLLRSLVLAMLVVLQVRFS